MAVEGEQPYGVEEQGGNTNAEEMSHLDSPSEEPTVERHSPEHTAQQITHISEMAARRAEKSGAPDDKLEIVDWSADDRRTAIKSEKPQGIVHDRTTVVTEQPTDTRAEYNEQMSGVIFPDSLPKNNPSETGRHTETFIGHTGDRIGGVSRHETVKTTNATKKDNTWVGFMPEQDEAGQPVVPRAEGTRLSQDTSKGPEWHKEDLTPEQTRQAVADMTSEIRSGIAKKETRDQGLEQAS
jgi:hypothetical protein